MQEYICSSWNACGLYAVSSLTHLTVCFVCREKELYLLCLSSRDSFCSPWPAIHSLIQSDWLPPDAESTKLDLSVFCFYKEHWERNKRLRGRKQNPLMNWLTSDVIWAKSASAYFQEGRCTSLNCHHPPPWLRGYSIPSREFLVKLYIRDEVTRLEKIKV